MYLGNKDKYSIFKDTPYNLCFISHKLPFSAQIRHFLFKRYCLFFFCEACTKN
jgi:hypothetical protein